MPEVLVVETVLCTRGAAPVTARAMRGAATAEPGRRGVETRGTGKAEHLHA